MESRRYYPVLEFMAISGHGRTQVYALLAQGRLVAVKAGRRTLIVAESADAYLRSLPRATFVTGLNSRSAEGNRARA